MTNIRHLDFEDNNAVEEFKLNAKSLMDFDLTKFQTLYVKARCDGHNKRQAAIKAGSTSKRPEQVGSELEKSNPKVCLAISWYGSRVLQAAALDKESLAEMGLRVYELALESNNLEVARKAVSDLSLLHGFLSKTPSKTPKGIDEKPLTPEMQGDEDKPFNEYDLQKEKGEDNNEDDEFDLSKQVNNFMSTIKSSEDKLIN